MTSTGPIKTENGEVIDGNVNPTMKTGKDVEVKPVGDDGQPILGAKATLECQSPDRTHDGIEQEDGSYIFKDAIRANGSDKCVLTMEKPG